MVYLIGNTHKFTLKSFNTEDEEGSAPAILSFNCLTAAKTRCTEPGDLVLVPMVSVCSEQEVEELRQRIQDQQREIENLENQLTEK